MKFKSTILPILISVFTIFTLASTSVSSADHHGQALKQLKETNEAYIKAFLAKDIDKFISFYTSDAVMHPPGEASIRGTKAIRAEIGKNWPTTTFNSVKMVSFAISPTGDMGHSEGLVDLILRDDKGAETPILSRDIHVWARQDDGSWKLSVDIWN